MDFLALPKGCETRCPGCQHRQFTASESATVKVSGLKKILSDFSSSFDSIRTAPSEARLGYRKKTLLHAKWEGGFWKFGLLLRIPGTYDYEVLDIPNCPVHSSTIQKVLVHLSKSLPNDATFPLVNIMISGSLLTLVLKTARAPEIPKVDWAGLGLSGVFLNLNPSAGHRVFANRGWKKIWGESFAQDPDSSWYYGPESFRQQVGTLHDQSIEEAVSFFDGKVDAVLDLYSGSGRTLSRWIEKGWPTLGVELNGDAVESAKKNLSKDYILRGRVSDRLPQIEAWKSSLHLLSKETSLGVYLNPPRMGIEPEVSEWLTRDSGAEAVVYLSCSAGSLNRDLRNLTRSVFSVVKIMPYDFFPQTHHVEVLCFLVRNSS